MHFPHSNALHLTTHHHPPPTASMLLLPEGSYPSLEDANTAVLAVAFREGYGIAHARSKNDKYGETCKVWIACDKQGKYTPLANERDTGTRQRTSLRHSERSFFKQQRQQATRVIYLLRTITI